MSNQIPDDTLESCWAELLVEPAPSPDLTHFDPHPGELVIGTQQRVLVRISPDGRIRYGEGYTPNEVAEEFWTAMALKRAGMSERLMHLDLMEQLLVRIGQADLRTERARIRAAQVDATPEDKFVAERTMGHLESLVHQMIEISRGLALRRGEIEPVHPPPEEPPSLDLD